jgi:hypothetical protein
LSTWTLAAGNEWQARDPVGRFKPTDRSPREDERRGEAGGGRRLRAARNGYLSLRLWVSGAGDYQLSVEFPGQAIEVDLFRAWYHRMAPANGESDAPAVYSVDALVPVASGSFQRLPDPDNAVPGQTHQEFWLDLFVLPDAAVGTATGRVVLSAGRERIEWPLTIEVLPLSIPDDDVLICNSHSFGCRWLYDFYPQTFAACRDSAARWVRTIDLLHDYFRINYEHRALLTNRGVGHSGLSDPIYRPTLRGAGRDKSLDDWTWYDRHYAPLLDGSAFSKPYAGAARPRRPARPPWCIPTPMSPVWPADYLWWGQPGFEAEFVRCVRQFDEHFRRNGWLTTRPYFFFHHKKRYRWFEWDGDEPKFARDDGHFIEMGRLLREAVQGSPVPWTYRMDASWRIAEHVDGLGGIIDWWVCGGFAKWFPESLLRARERGDIVWTYSGAPEIRAASSGLLEQVWLPWARGLAGHCRWQTVDPGPDPWFNCQGAAIGLVYPGERFGIAGPIPSIRLKLQRNAVQDVNLLSARRAAGETGRRAVARLVERVPLRLWEEPPPVVRRAPPEDWDSRNLAEGVDEDLAAHQVVDPLWWADVRAVALEVPTCD